MVKFIDRREVDIEDSPFKGYDKSDFALYYIKAFGGNDGGHHKDWVLDQVARILNDTKVKIILSEWDDGTKVYNVSLRLGSDKYYDWVAELKEGEDGPETYGYDTGIAS